MASLPKVFQEKKKNFGIQQIFKKGRKAFYHTGLSRQPTCHKVEAWL